MSRRHSTSPGSKPITTRLHKLTALLDELAKAPHQPEASDEFLPTKLLKRVLSYVGSGGAAAASLSLCKTMAPSILAMFGSLLKTSILASVGSKPSYMGLPTNNMSLRPGFADNLLNSSKFLS